MPANLSTRPTPVLLTDQFNLTGPNGKWYFHSLYSTAQDTRIRRDKTIGWVTFEMVVFFLILVGISHVVTTNEARWRLTVPLRRHKRPSKRLSFPIDDPFDLSRIMEAGISDEELQIRFDSQGTTLRGSPSSGLKITMAAKAISSRNNICPGLDRFPEFDDRWFWD